MLTKELIKILLSLSDEDKEKPAKIWDSASDRYIDLTNVGVIKINKYGENCVLLD